VCVCSVKPCDILTIKNAMVKYVYVTQYAICDRLAHRIAVTVRPNSVPALWMDHRKQSGASSLNPPPPPPRLDSPVVFIVT